MTSETRNTKQRQVIYDYLCSVHSHPTAEEVYYQIVKKLPNLTLATVYRNLNLLASQKKILRLEINKEYHFDATISGHQHIVCKKCGMIDDIHSDKINRYALNKLKTNNNNNQFQVDNVQIIFEGICKKCK